MACAKFCSTVYDTLQWSYTKTKFPSNLKYNGFWTFSLAYVLRKSTMLIMIDDDNAMYGVA